MSRIKLLLNVVEDLRTLADDVEILAKAVAEGQPAPKPEQTTVQQAPKPTPPPEEKPKITVTHEMVRELAVNLSRAGKREEIKSLIESYGVKNITSVAEADLESFYADLRAMEVS